MRGNVQAMLTGSPTLRVTETTKKRGLDETSRLGKIKRPRLIHGLDDTDLDITISQETSIAAGDIDDDDDDDDGASDWDADANSECPSDTDCDNDEDEESLAAVFEALKERAASKMAVRPATQNDPLVTMPLTAGFQDPPPPYASAVNSPLASGETS